MRSTIAACSLFAALLAAGIAAAAECPQGALGVSRTIAIDPNDHPRVGSMQYPESLPLNDHEVVLTFDDGPLPPYTSRVLDTLASECVKATFFMVGRMVRGYPAIAQRVYAEGHTIANHSQNHPFTFHKMTVDQAAHEIEEAHASLVSALGDPNEISPFFRIPGLLRGNAVEQYLAAHGYMTFSVDFLADDWRHIKSKEITRRAIERIEARRRGILLLHDIQPATVLALPDILKELKARGYKIVHMVPATADRPKTVTEPEQWVARRTPEQQFWANVPVVGEETSESVLPVPSPESFGIEHFGEPTVTIALAQTLERQLTRPGESQPTKVNWPKPISYAGSPDAAMLPVPGAVNFAYSRAFHLDKPDKLKLAKSKHDQHKHATKKTGKPSAKSNPAAKDHAKEPESTSSIPEQAAPSDEPPRPPREIGHQLTMSPGRGSAPWPRVP
jgi:peptidoglycan/xylan/chitin deacetylase (PgdA/CDA1 family)